MNIPIISREVISNIQRCSNWHELYHLIQYNPVEYNVHLCLIKCNKSFIQRNFICSLIIGNLLDINEVSIYYDFYINQHSDITYGVLGNRCFLNYVQYLGASALRDRDIDAYNRFAGAWNAPIYVGRYRTYQNTTQAFINP